MFSVGNTLFLCAAMLLGGGGCSGGCASPFQPLPKPLPAGQVVEGGVQVRITENGLKTITAVAKELIANFTAGGICIPTPADIDLGILGHIDVCYKRDCAGAASGCKVNLNLGTVSTSTVGTDVLRADIRFSGSVNVPLRYPTFLGDITCNLGGSMSNARLAVDVRVGTSATTGELTLNLAQIRALDVSPRINLCDLGLPSDVVSFITDGILALLGTDFGLILVNFITPTINDFIQGFLPRPLGLEGVLDVGSLLSSIAPGVSSKIEIKGVPGGYARLPANGISLGVIVGLNADRNTATRGATDSSEPSLCVPQWTAPDLAMPPTSLGKAPGRQTFTLAPSGAFMGAPDPVTDVAIGLSQTVLDLAGHHLVASGALCLGVGSAQIPRLGVGSAQIPQLNLGTVGLLVRSLSELGTGREPVLMVLRPTQPVSFDIGDGPPSTSPYLTVHLKDLEIDFYALLFERYVRAFTVGATLDVGLNLSFMLDENDKPVLVPTLVGLDASKIQVTISNSKLLREPAAQLEAVFPTLLNLFLPLLAEGIPAFPVPAIEGFTLSDLRLGKVRTTEDDFLAVYASLQRVRSKPEPRERAVTEARLVRVSAPAPERVVAYLNEARDGALPEVELELGGRAPGGAALEWQWNINGGLWRPFTRDSRLVIRDLALAVQGHHKIGVRARAAGDYASTDLAIVEVPVTIHTAAPRIGVAELRREGDELVVPARDLVTADDAVLLAAGAPDAAAPATAWAASQGRFAIAELEPLLAGGQVRVFARDELGNVSSALLDVGPLLGVRPAETTGGCAIGGGRASDGLAALLGVLAALATLHARRARAGCAALVLLALGCSSSKLGKLECSINGDCSATCEAGKLGVCGPDGTCTCIADIPVGTIGSHSDLAVSSSGATWLAAYNATHGDMMAAQVSAPGRVDASRWEFVDGVPAVTPSNPVSMVRGGITEPGDDVGLYGSIAVGAGEPALAYYDRTHRSLRFAARGASRWTSMQVDAGDATSKDVGRYTAITLDAMGRPGIAYLAIIEDGANVRSEVRFAQAKVAAPTLPSDWQVSIVETQAAPADPSGGVLDDVPYVNGVFVAAARTAAGDPVVAYHDRPAGDLKLAEWDRAAGQFKRPVIVDGAEAGEEVGWYPSLAVATDGKIHIAYVDAANDNLMTVVYPGGTPELVDDGLRMDGTTPGGQPRPVYHFVGDNSVMLVSPNGARGVVYQDGTAHELLLAAKPGATWTRTRVAGSESPYKGSYGFYAAAALSSSGEVVMSSFAVNQTTYDQWVEVFKMNMP